MTVRVELNLQRSSTANGGDNLALRIEWCRARARAHRWSEEVTLLLEEMRRILAFFEWQGNWWDRQGEGLPFVSAQQSEGVNAYAKRQAAIRRALRIACIHDWKDVDEWVKMGDRDIAMEGIDEDADVFTESAPVESH